MSLPRIRWVIFVRSLVASAEHPLTRTFRLLGRSLVHHGQDALFLEERGNPLTVEAFRRRGAAALRELATAWPELRYQTVEPRTGRELVEWLGRTLATADLALVELGVDEQLVQWVGQLTRPHLQTVLVDLLPDDPILEQQRRRLDPAPYSAIVCHPANLAAYQGRTSARRLVAVSGTPKECAAAIADTALATVLQATQAPRNHPSDSDGHHPRSAQWPNGSLG
ncbi:MAG: hypothetical protein NZL87_08420 [Thermomicrobium sp.]|nr:hypothetical protein [Thermomicrobium sp.]MDW8059358.1 hypothetical protein [Thermomicrobium sp.]